MIVIQSIFEASMQLLAADPATLAPVANANKIGLVKSAWVPSATTEFADVVLADFDGSTPIAAGVGTQPEGLDPATGDPVVDIKAPAGGFRFETTGITNLPQTIFGFVLLDNAGTTYLAGEVFQTPILLTAVNQRVDVPQPNIRLLNGSMT